MDQLAALQAAANQRRRAEATTLYQQVRTRLLSMGAITLGVACLSRGWRQFHVNRLQRQIERQRSAEQQNRQDLERLSASLVEAQERDRRKLARELHDEVGQALTAVKMDIGIALRSENQARVRSALEEASELAEATLRGVRDLSQLLHPSMLDDFGLPTTLAAYLRSFSHRTGIRAQLAETVDDRLIPEIEVVRLSDRSGGAQQHRAAQPCDRLHRFAERRRRYPAHHDRRQRPRTGRRGGYSEVRRGLGLIGMRERAQALGGTLHHRESLRRRHALSVTLPLLLAAAPAVDSERQAG